MFLVTVGFVVGCSMGAVVMFVGVAVSNYKRDLRKQLRYVKVRDTWLVQMMGGKETDLSTREMLECVQTANPEVK